MKRYLMKCGHIANAIANYDENKPACVICDCLEIEKEANGDEGLENRKARCSACGDITSSGWGLPFFRYCPDREYDEYYCGCWGWD